MLLTSTATGLNSFRSFWSASSRNVNSLFSFSVAANGGCFTSDVEEAPLAATKKENKELTLRKLAEQKLLEEFSPVAVLVNRIGQVLYIHGQTGLYLELSPGLSDVNNILKMARDGLQSKLTTALHDAAKDQEKVFYPNLRIEGNKDITRANLSISPIINDSIPKFDGVLYLVVLEQISSSKNESSEEIPFLSRITAIVDAFDAMTNDRPYNQNQLKSHQETIAEIKRCAGSQFDSELVEVFLELYEEDKNVS